MKKNITVMHFVYVLYGGVANVAAGLMNYQHSMGCKTILVYCVDDPSMDSQLDFEADKIKCPMRGFPGESMLFGMKIPQIYREYQKEHLNETVLVHAHNIQAAGAFSRIENIPMLCTLHGFNAMEVTEGRRIVSNFLYRHALKKLLNSKKKNKVVTAVSKAIAQSGECQRVKHSERIQVIHNFADVDFRNKQAHRAFQVGHVGDLSVEKGWDTFWGAYQMLPPDYQKEICLCTAGKELDYTAEWIEQKKKQCAYPDNIQYLGYVDNAKVDFISKLDLLVLASRNEGLGLVQIEAMGYGIPVLGRDTGGICEVLQDGYNGFIITDEADLCQKIQRLFDDKALYARLSSNARKTYEARFTKSVIMDEYTQAYEQIMGAKM